MTSDHHRLLPPPTRFSTQSEILAFADHVESSEIIVETILGLTESTDVACMVHDAPSASEREAVMAEAGRLASERGLPHPVWVEAFIES